MNKKSLLLLILTLTYSINPCKSFQAENNLPTVLAVGGVAAAGTFAYKFVLHGIELYQVQQLLKNSMVEATNKGTNFSFATWQRSVWPTGSDLLKQKNQVYERLKREATKLSDMVFIYDSLGTRIGPERVRMVDVQKAISQEKERYERLLDCIGSLTDAPYQCVQVAKEQRNCTAQGYIRLYDNQQALLNAAKLISLTEQQLQDFGHQLHAKCVPSITCHLICFPSYDPRTWALAPWYPWAAQLYWYVYKNYIRLLALKSIVDGHIVGKPQNDNFVVKQLRILRDAISVMRVTQPGVHTSSVERSKQHAQIFKFNEDLKILIARVQTHSEFKALLHPLNSLLRYIPTVQQQLNVSCEEGHDPVVGMLEALDVELERLIEVQEKE